VVGLKVALTLPVIGGEFGEDSVGRWQRGFMLPIKCNDLGLPAAVDATPAVTFKTEQSEATMISVVAAHDVRTAPGIERSLAGRALALLLNDGPTAA
jgi:hypothetical protein